MQDKWWTPIAVLAAAALIWGMFAHYDGKNEARASTTRGEIREEVRALTTRIDDVLKLLVEIHSAD